MESRLPKPKLNLTNALQQSTKVINQKVVKNQNDLPSTSSNNVPNTLKKTKSTMNIATKCRNENKAPAEENLNRSKTLPSITTKGLKRSATVSTVHQKIKRPFIKSVNKTNAEAQSTTSKCITTNKTSQSTVARRVPQVPHQNNIAPKPSKWDLKGQLAHKTGELSNIRQKYKEIESNYNELQEQVKTLAANEIMYKVKAEEYENLNKEIDSKLMNLTAEMNKLQEERENLIERLTESEESLKEFKEKCASQEALLNKHKIAVKDLESKLELQTKINQDLNTGISELQCLTHTMDKERRVLHNAIQEMKGNIRVFCRVRPTTPNEAGKPTCSINFIDECTIEIGKSSGLDTISCSGKTRGTQEFSFDKVFPPTCRQESIFEELALLVQSALEGYNVCVFAYGQTGSGKTYTMEGLPGIETEGMIPRTVRHIFQEMKQFQLLDWEYQIEASFLEIYNEQIVDLLDSQSKNHEIRMADSKGHDLYVSNLKVQEIRSPEELHECLLIAQRNRAVAATQSNERSSRSHSVARIKLIGTHRRREEISIGNLNLVDLAGSERLRNEESVRIMETKNINKSLANLSNVILALLKKQEHIPYRNSKLTHLLMPSLGGNSKTLMLLNISPLEECYNETLNSLRFASHVNSCKMGIARRTRTVLQNSTLNSN
ncbi:protein claret segregational [Xylocopa sonorina]|uniref:protein claret segregational n=1 Tax=Xylocopa sonorina TaxID=1818115 RepID=UPI00403A8E0F